MSEANIGYESNAESVPQVQVETVVMHQIGFVIDGVVQDVLICDDRLSALFLSSPTIIEIISDKADGQYVGWVYDQENKKLIPPQSE